MAIVLEQTVGQRGSGGDRTAASLAVAAGDVLIAICTAQDSNTNNLPVGSVIFNGSENFTLVIAAGGSAGAGQPCRIEIWRLNAPTATTANVVADFASGINETTLTVFRLSGADAADLIEAQDSDTANGFAPAMSLVTAAAGAFALGGIVSEAEITGYGTSQTERSNFDDQGFENSNTSTEPLASAGTHDHSYGMSGGNPYAQASIAINASAGGGETSDVKKLSGVLHASLKKISGIVEASVKKVSGVSNV